MTTNRNWMGSISGTKVVGNRRESYTEESGFCSYGEAVSAAAKLKAKAEAKGIVNVSKYVTFAGLDHPSWRRDEAREIK